MRMMTNNPKKIRVLRATVVVSSRVPIECEPKPENIRYLLTKCQKLGHMMKIGKDKKQTTGE
jgi:3,4-dihydroxy 2-butanone 4-phosphate synthase/GTP cyclohydrolase II